MGSGITERTELYEILAKIADNQSSYDSYSNMKLYYNEMDRTARIWRTLNEDDEIEIIAIFNPERILLNQSDYYAGALLKNVIVRTNDIGVNEIGLGGFIDYDRLVENICIALGVKLGKDFAQNNPTIWQELKECCQKYIGNVNNAPYFMVEQNSSLYMSYVPEAMIIEVAIYLANLGIFSTSDITLYNSCASYLYESIYGCFSGEINFGLYWESNRYELSQYIPSFDSYYSLFSKNDAIKNINTYIDNCTFFNYKEQLKTAINAIITEYELEIDWNSILLFNITNGSGATIIKVFQIPTNCRFRITSSSYRFYNFIEDCAVVIYTLEYTYASSTYTYNKTTLQIIKDTIKTQSYSLGDINTMPTNVNYNKYVKFYTNNQNILYDTFPKLNANTTYNIKLTPYNFYLSRQQLIQLGLANITINDDDLIMFNSNNLYIFRNVNTVSFSDARIYDYDSYNENRGYIYNQNGLLSGRSNSNRVSPVMYSGFSGNTITFDTSKNYEIYYANLDSTINYNVYQLIESGTVSSYTFPTSGDYRVFYANFGELITIEPEEVVTDLTLEPGATYPSNVIDKASFITTYPSWVYLTSKQPKYDEDGFIIDATTDTNWLSLDVGEPVNQAEAQAGDLDNVELDILVRDIDKAEEDDDSGENPDLVPEGEDEGTTELIDPDSLPDAFEGGLIYQDKMTVNELRAFALYARTFHVDEWVFGKVIDKVIALAQTYDGLWNSTLSTDNQNIIIGGVDTGCTATSVAKSVKHIWCGTVDINPFFENYNDITETTLSIYLPFVGMVDLDIRDFHNKVVGLTADVDSFTGSIVYSVFDYEDQDTYRLLYTYSGNCQQLLPLEATDFSQLLRNVANTAISATTTALTLL